MREPDAPGYDYYVENVEMPLKTTLYLLHVLMLLIILLGFKYKELGRILFHLEMIFMTLHAFIPYPANVECTAQSLFSQALYTFFFPLICYVDFKLCLFSQLASLAINEFVVSPFARQHPIDGGVIFRCVFLMILSFVALSATYYVSSRGLYLASHMRSQKNEYFKLLNMMDEGMVVIVDDNDDPYDSDADLDPSVKNVKYDRVEFCNKSAFDIISRTQSDLK